MTLPVNAVTGPDDVLDVFPKDFQTEAHPVLDGLTTGLAGMHDEYQKRSDFISEQSDVLTATEGWLDGICEDLVVPRALSEGDDSLRARALAWRDPITPSSIIATVNEILAPHTDKLCQLSESILDGWFVHDVQQPDDNTWPVWDSYVGDAGDELNPTYPDRMYTDDTSANGGSVRLQSDPGCSRVFDGLGRMFLLRIPSIPAKQYLYQVVANAVQRIKGHGIRFALLVDESL